MSTRLEYRDDLNHKLLALEDGGYGDFDYDDTDLNFFLEVAIARLFPYIYKKASETLTLTDYGTNGRSSVTPTFPERVFLIEDATERVPLVGWKVSGTNIVNLDKYGSGFVTSSVNVYYYDAYSLPADDVTDAGISDVYTPLIVLGAQIEALEARLDSGVRGDPPPTGQFQEVPLLDRLIARYDKLRDGLAMTLPGVTL